MKWRIYALCLFLLLIPAALAPVIKSQTAPNQSPEDLPNPCRLIKDNLKVQRRG